MLTLLKSAFTGAPAYLLVAAVFAWYLPAFGQRVLAFLRDFKRYRRGD